MRYNKNELVILTVEAMPQLMPQPFHTTMVEMVFRLRGDYLATVATYHDTRLMVSATLTDAVVDNKHCARVRLLHRAACQYQQQYQYEDKVSHFMRT